ncbi:MAG: S-layer protein, partial [bacterium]
MINRFCRWAGVFCLAVLHGLSGVRAAEVADRVSFSNDVIPVLTKSGCNMGVCHAKANGGQKGFQLSLLGFEPADDFDSLVKEVRGRRVSLVQPGQSLVLLKGSGQVQHGGGVRLAKESPGYSTILRWIEQGAPMDEPGGPALARLELEPQKSFLQRGQKQQLKLTAVYSDGRKRDVTGQALFESNDRAMAEVSDSGLVSIADIPGKVAVMVRYQGRVAVFNAAVPLGARVDSLPPEKNFI